MIPASGVRKSRLTGGEERGADAVALGKGEGAVGLFAQPPAVQDDGGLRGEGGQHPAVLGGRDPAGQRPRHVVADGHLDVGVLGPPVGSSAMRREGLSARAMADRAPVSLSGARRISRVRRGCRRG
ncbi:hypothetical protein GA0115245_144723 [Streptomyces sp. di188]|nr:hypothetical protein GA0115238_102723 [Streptomyces sp. di50b]SCE50850.1 hypothetical protein GA0115245_144723 [Streptomyces sp. di188]